MVTPVVWTKCYESSETHLGNGNYNIYLTERLRGTEEIMYVNGLTGHVATASCPNGVAIEIISNDGHK